MAKYHYKENPYKLPAETYIATVSMIRASDKFPDRLTELQSRIISAMAHASAYTPPKYIEGVVNNIIFNTCYPANAQAGLYERYKARFIFIVAVHLGLYLKRNN